MSGSRQLGALALVLATACAPAAAAARPDCAAPPALTAITAPLDRTAARIDAGRPLTIVAFGSSSTEGVGASTPEADYPSRLADALEARFPAIEIRVVNRGVGGEDAPEEFARLGREVIVDHPDLVIWQVGTNAVLRRDNLAADEQLIRRGIDLIKQGGSDLILMDLQYAPRVLARPAYAEMERILAELAQRADVGFFGRFEIMRYWARTGQLDRLALVGGDGLHMTDASYGCLAARLAAALASNWRAHRLAADKLAHSAVDAVVGLEPPGTAPPSGVARHLAVSRLH